MELDLDKLKNQATALIRDACNPHGIRSGIGGQENHRQIRARDSIIAGIAGLLSGDEEIMKGLGNAIQTLAKYQHPRGMIPSSVLPDETDPEISYGTLTGRVDTNSWFIIGSCLYMVNNPDGSLVQKLKPKIEQVLELLDCWEFNARGLLYTPISGNWADEYPINGHTLYDNLLRLWALRLYNELFDDADRQKQAQEIRDSIVINFWPQETKADHTSVYHPRAFKEAAESQPEHFASAIDPRGYSMYFDTAGHGLALLLDLVSDEQFEQLQTYLDTIFRQVSTKLLPAFWPVISSDDPLWDSLKDNFSYDFKNYPGSYQNGGIWPVWMGLFALGSGNAGNYDLPKEMLGAWMEIEEIDDIGFSEYISSSSLKTGGKDQCCCSASGLIFLISAIQKDSLGKLHIM